MARYLERDPVATLPDSGVTAGTFTNATITVNSQGIITSASSGSVGATNFGDLNDVDLTGLAVDQFVRFDGADWVPHTLLLNSVDDVDITGPANGEILQFNGSDWVNTALSTAGLLIPSDIGVTVQAWDAELDGLATLSGTGYVVHTGAGTFIERTFQEGEGISLTNDNGVLGNTEIGFDIPSLTTSIVDSNDDFIAFYSTAGGGHRKITPENLILDSAPVTDATNVGVGANVFKTINAKTLQFRSFLAGSSAIILSISGTLDEIVIDVASGLEDIATLTPTNNNFIVGNGTSWTQEGPSDARNSLGLGTMALEDANDYLLLSGGTMTGDINMGSNFITNLLDPVNPQDAATKAYVDGITPNVVAGDGLTSTVIGSTITFDVGAGTGIIVNTNDVELDVGFTDGRYYQQTELSSTLSGTEGASLIGTDTKTNLGGATNVEDALEYLNTNFAPVQFRQDISVWNLDITTPTATRAIVNDIEVARFDNTTDGAIYRDIMLPPNFDNTLDFTLYISLAKETANTGVIRMALAWQRQGLGFTPDVVQSFDNGANTNIDTLSWTIDASTFSPLDMMTLRLTRLADSDIADTFGDGADFFGAFITQ